MLLIMLNPGHLPSNIIKKNRFFSVILIRFMTFYLNAHKTNTEQSAHTPGVAIRHQGILSQKETDAHYTIQLVIINIYFKIPVEVVPGKS